MRAAIRRVARGERAALPIEIRIHLVAARYGVSPDEVRAWSADDLVIATQLLEVPNG